MSSTSERPHPHIYPRKNHSIAAAASGHRHFSLRICSAYLVSRYNSSKRSARFLCRCGRNRPSRQSWQFISGKRIDIEFLAWANSRSSGGTSRLVPESSDYSGRPYWRSGQDSVSFWSSSTPRAVCKPDQRLDDSRFFGISIIEKQQNETMGQKLRRTNGDTNQSYLQPGHSSG